MGHGVYTFVDQNGFQTSNGERLAIYIGHIRNDGMVSDLKVGQ